jgi:hypothetical protein
MKKKVNEYWPQSKVYLYGTCALFPRKLSGEILSAEYLGSFIEHFPLFTDENQVKALKEYETRKMFKVEFLETRMSSEFSALDALEKLNPNSLTDDKNKYKFRITDIDQDKFKTKLVEYLKEFSDDTLTIKSLPVKPDSPDVLRGLLREFAIKAHRKRPKLTLYDIWPNMNDRNVLLNPFWEIIFASELIFDDAKIIDIGQSPILAKKKDSIKSESLPYAELEVVNPKWTETVTQKTSASTVPDSKKSTSVMGAINPNTLKVLPTNYDSANHILNLAGIPYTIMKQGARKNVTKEAVLIGLLFSVKHFSSGVGISNIYPVTDHKNKREQVKNARALVTAINKKLPEELKGQELIKFDNTKFYIHPQYKKN